MLSPYVNFSIVLFGASSTITPHLGETLGLFIVNVALFASVYVYSLVLANPSYNDILPTLGVTVI